MTAAAHAITGPTPGPTHRDMLATGMTYRCLDHYTRTGLLRLARPAAGSGIPRHWQPGEQQVAARMVRLVRAGLTPQAAEQVARGQTELGPGVHITIEDPT